jgi:Lar family restriction alleviation protein
MANDLLPCPFCGRDGHIVHSRDGDTARVTCVFWPVCMGSGTWKHSNDEAIEAWNRRAAAPEGKSSAGASPVSEQPNSLADRQATAIREALEQVEGCMELCEPEDQQAFCNIRAVVIDWLHGRAEQGEQDADARDAEQAAMYRLLRDTKAQIHYRGKRGQLVGVQIGSLSEYELHKNLDDAIRAAMAQQPKEPT